MKGKPEYLQYIKEQVQNYPTRLQTPYAIDRRYRFGVSILEHLEQQANDVGLTANILFVDSGFEISINGHTMFTTNIILVKQIFDLAINLKGAQKCD